MTTLPKDIERKIDQLFKKEADRKYVRKWMQDLWITSLNVGPDQLARSILSLSDGQVGVIKSIIDQNFYGDPRDVIVMAEAKMGNPKHYFIPPFQDKEKEKRTNGTK